MPLLSFREDLSFFDASKESITIFFFTYRLLPKLLYTELHLNYIWTTSTAFRPDLEECPVEGVFSVEVPEESSSPNNLSPSSDDASLFICSEQSMLTSKCSNPAHMQLLTTCSQNTASEHSNRSEYHSPKNDANVMTTFNVTCNVSLYFLVLSLLVSLLLLWPNF